MAITSEVYNSMEKEAKGYLEISAGDFYFDKMRPFMQNMLLKCKTDGELIRTLEKVMNAADSFCIQKDYNSMMESFTVLEKAITNRNYFNGVMKKAPEAEREMVRELIGKITDLRMIVKCEPPYQAKEQQKRERLNYRASNGHSPIGENEDYITHNMKTLNEANPKARIPNV